MNDTAASIAPSTTTSASAPARRPARKVAKKEAPKARETKTHPLEKKILVLLLKAAVKQKVDEEKGLPFAKILSGLLRGKPVGDMENALIYRMKRLREARLVDITGGKKFARYVLTRAGASVAEQDA
jgi:hypothetical protein